ncbi:hypothetical protein FQR65_LT12241 [Abscondita terminalis]|nr:hypothetical protein FQR65_LT12241 [Abscondita terminalis]
MCSTTPTAIFFVVTLVCTSDAFDKRIINGQIAFDGQFPYQASLRTLSTNEHFCGGSIVKPTWVLTAAHCLLGLNFYKVIVGTNYANDSGVAFEVSQELFHPSYNRATRYFDVGLIKTKTSIAYTNKINRIALATSLSLFDYNAVVSGWGLTSYPSNTSSFELRWLKTERISHFICQLYASRILYTINPSQLCTITNAAGVCLGDSGSALVANGKQIGIVSQSIPCAVGFPDIYTNVPYVFIWISSSIMNP